MVRITQPRTATINPIIPSSSFKSVYSPWNSRREFPAILKIFQNVIFSGYWYTSVAYTDPTVTQRPINVLPESAVLYRLPCRPPQTQVRHHPRAIT